MIHYEIISWQKWENAFIYVEENNGVSQKAFNVKH